MKRLIIAALLCGVASLGLAQKTTTTTVTTTTINGSDTTKTTSTTTNKTKVTFGNMSDFRAKRDSMRHNRKPSGFNFGLTFSRFAQERFFKLSLMEIKQRGF
jgi:hypothetical protein